MRLKEVRRPAKLLRYRLLAFFAVFGPGFITITTPEESLPIPKLVQSLDMHCSGL